MSGMYTSRYAFFVFGFVRVITPSTYCIWRSIWRQRFWKSTFCHFNPNVSPMRRPQSLPIKYAVLISVLAKIVIEVCCESAIVYQYIVAGFLSRNFYSCGRIFCHLPVLMCTYIIMSIGCHLSKDTRILKTTPRTHKHIRHLAIPRARD